VTAPAAVTTASGGQPVPEGPRSASFSSPRRTLDGWGTAARIDLPAPWPEYLGRVAEVLEGFGVEDEVQGPGTGPVAFGALPFDRSSPATLVVPAVVHGHTAEGTRWITTVADRRAPEGGDAADHAEHERGVAHHDAPAELTVRSVRPPEQWCGAVAAATDRIAAGELTKVVLARELRVHAGTPYDPDAVLERLRELYPAALRYCVDGFVGASPELLVSRVGDIVRAQPMAGTTARTGEPEADQRRAAELLSSAKNRAEHQITIDAVHDTLLPWCSYLDAEPAPTVVAAGPVQHLATVVEGRLSRPAPSVLELVGALHPTPAVGGWPRDEALALIEELEGADRGRYAGPVGWVDARGNGAWAVGIRGVELDGCDARLFAGVGVVADSDPLAELAETRAKAQSLLSVLVRP
jgi:menaquinone-specific isochorismate synthase